MRANQDIERARRTSEGWTTADKTGSGDCGSTNDVGIACRPDSQRLLLAVMTRVAGRRPEGRQPAPARLR